MEVDMATDAKLLEEMGTYKYGFKDSSDEYFFKSQKGLNREIVKKISEMKGEPEWMLDYRLKAFEHFIQRPMPGWGADIAGHLLLCKTHGRIREILG
jgi:Fe-S cluster assembly protein SufB